MIFLTVLKILSSVIALLLSVSMFKWEVLSIKSFLILAICYLIVWPFLINGYLFFDGYKNVKNLTNIFLSKVLLNDTIQTVLESLRLFVKETVFSIRLNRTFSHIFQSKNRNVCLPLVFFLYEPTLFKFLVLLFVLHSIGFLESGSCDPLRNNQPLVPEGGEGLEGGEESEGDEESESDESVIDIIRDPYYNIGIETQVINTYPGLSELTTIPNIGAVTFADLVTFSQRAVIADSYVTVGQAALLVLPEQDVNAPNFVSIEDQMDTVRDVVTPGLYPNGAVGDDEPLHLLDRFLSDNTHSIYLSQNLMTACQADPQLSNLRLTNLPSFRIHFKNLCLYMLDRRFDNSGYPYGFGNWLNEKWIEWGDNTLPGNNYQSLSQTEYRELEETLDHLSRTIGLALY